MPNPHKGDIEFKAGDKTYILRYSIGAICSLEAGTGKSLMELADELRDVKRLSMTLVRNVLHAGLTVHQPNITLEEAGELIIAGGGAMVVMAKFSEAMVAAFPAEVPGAGPPKPASH